MSFISDLIIQWGPLITAVITAIIAYITLKVSQSANRSADETYELNKQALKISIDSKELNNQTFMIMNETKKINEQTLKIIENILDLNKDVLEQKQVQEQQSVVSSLKKCLKLFEVEKESIKNKDEDIKNLFDSSNKKPIGFLRTDFLDNIEEETKKHDFHRINGAITLLKVEIKSLNNKINKHDFLLSIKDISKNKDSSSKDNNTSKQFNNNEKEIYELFNKVKDDLLDLEGLISSELEKAVENSE